LGILNAVNGWIDNVECLPTISVERIKGGFGTTMFVSLSSELSLSLSELDELLDVGLLVDDLVVGVVSRFLFRFGSFCDVSEADVSRFDCV
jgi:hypothetical protein